MAAVMQDDRCPVLDELENAPPNMAKTAKGFDALFRRYADLGRHGLTAELFHEVDKAHGIWEFIKGRLRVLCFVAPEDGALLILTHSMIKKQQKTPASEISKSIEVLRHYQAARARSEVEILPREGEQND